MSIDVDHYLVLGVPRTADAATIRAAYVGLAKRYHPDVAAGSPELAAFNFRQITEAYQELADPQSRARYDARVQAALAAERVRREQMAQAAAAGRAAKAAKAKMAEKLFGKAASKAAGDFAAKAGIRRPTLSPKPLQSKPSLPPRPPAHLRHADEMARRRGAVVLAAVLLAFIGVGGYLATRAVKGPGFEVMAAETARPVEVGPPARPKPKPVPPVNQASQLGPSTLPPSAPTMPGALAARPTGPKLAPAEITNGQSVCIADDGAKFAIINRGGEPTVIYNGAPPVRASVQFSDRHLVVLTGIVPSDTIMIGIQRGQESVTHVYYADTRGAIIQTVGARCEGQAY